MPISRSDQHNILHSFTAVSRLLRSKFSVHTAQVTCNMYCNIVMPYKAIFHTM